MDYGEEAFDLEKGSFIGLEPLETLILTKEPDSGTRSNYPVILVSSKTEQYITYHVSEAGKIAISVPENQFREYRMMTLTPAIKELLQTHVIFPVLIDLFSRCAADEEYFTEQQNNLWYLQIQDLLNEKSIRIEDYLDDENGPLRLAQLVLKHPLMAEMEYMKNQAASRENEEVDV